jgi:hypothetical protein
LLLQESLKLQREAREEAATYFTSLDTKQQRGLNLQDQALQKQAALEQGQAAALRMLEEAEGHMGGLFELVEGRAADLAAAAAQQAEAQRRLAGELGGLIDSSHGIRTAVDVVISYQQRSDSGEATGRGDLEQGLGQKRDCISLCADAWNKP